MFDGHVAGSFLKLNNPPTVLGYAQKKNSRTTPCKPSSNLSVAAHFFSSFLVQTVKNTSSPSSKKMSSFVVAATANHTSNSLVSQAKTIGIIGGVSVLSTLVFLEKLVWWSSRDGGECIPFVVCSDPKLTALLPRHTSFLSFSGRNKGEREWNFSLIIESLRHKRKFLEQSGAHCIVMPCHVTHAWYDEISEGCLLPFLHVGECVASELKKAELKPIETGSSVRIGVLASNVTLTAGFYQDKLQNQGFEVVLPDKATVDHILLPAIEALKRRDMEGARNLLRIAIQILLVRAVNVVILASDEFQGLLPHDDPLIKKCTDPMDALARSTIRWAGGKVRKNT